jgi:hypothetical protein
VFSSRLAAASRFCGWTASEYPSSISICELPLLSAFAAAIRALLVVKDELSLELPQLWIARASYSDASTLI